MKYAGLGLQLLATIGFAAWAGFKLDEYFGFEFPALILSFVLIAFIGSMYQLYRKINKD